MWNNIEIKTKINDNKKLLFPIRVCLSFASHVFLDICSCTVWYFISWPNWKMQSGDNYIEEKKYTDHSETLWDIVGIKINIGSGI